MMNTMTRDDLLLQIRSRLAETITYSDQIARDQPAHPPNRALRILRGDWPGKSALSAALSAAAAGVFIGLLQGLVLMVIG